MYLRDAQLRYWRKEKYKPRHTLKFHGVSPLSSNNFAHRRQHSLHFLHRVVVDKPDPQEAAGALHVQLFGDVYRVVVSVPGEEAAIAQLRRQFQRREALNANHNGCATMFE